jgi:cytochrome c553
MTVLGIIFTLADKLIYNARFFVLELCAPSSLPDQQVGGPMMWVVGGLIIFAAFSIVFFRWFGEPETAESKGTPVPTPPAAYAGKTKPMANDQAAAEAGKQIFDANCSTCHGTDAKGDGPAAASLDPKPADLADLQSKFSDAYLY